MGLDIPTEDWFPPIHAKWEQSTLPHNISWAAKFGDFTLTIYCTKLGIPPAPEHGENWAARLSVPGSEWHDNPSLDVLFVGGLKSYAEVETWLWEKLGPLVNAIGDLR